ncbi:MAG: hypothetical protein GX438_05225 [Treponema sp.]|nr:hypothetical protein [Treponema sp.]
MPVLFNKTIMDLDSYINEYIVCLAHIQQSVTLTLKDKIDAFNTAESLAIDINGMIEKILSKNINSFNINDIYNLIDLLAKPINTSISKEIDIFEKRLKLEEKKYYSVKEAIELLTDNKNDIYLSVDKINRLLSYKKLYIDEVDREKNKELEKKLKETVNKYNQEFDSIRFKTFKEMIRGVNHKNEEYFYKTNSFVINNYLSELSIIESIDLNKDYIGFIIEKDKDIHIRIKKDESQIDYVINAQYTGDIASLYIIGYIVHSNSKVDFYINETFTKSSMNSYLNAFNITPIIKRWNECYSTYYANKLQKTNAEDDAKKHIDDFFSGRIN